MNDTETPNAGEELDALAPQADEAAAPILPPPAANRLKQFARGGNILLTGVFLAGLGVVYAMSLRVGPAEANAQQLLLQSNVDGALLALAATPAGAARADITDVFYYEASQRQVPARLLRRNPFALVSPRALQEEVLSPAQAPPAEDPKVQELSEAMKLLAGLSLQSVLAGERGSTAMISNNLLTQGQQIRGWTVKEIRPREVVLSWRQHTYVLRMSE